MTQHNFDLWVVWVFEVGAHPDTYQAYISLSSGQKLLGAKGQVDGLQVAQFFEATEEALAL